jgi:inosose dehydratase
VIRFGINPIGWSNDDFKELGGNIPLEQCLREAKEAGYAGVELGHKMGRESRVLRPLLQNHGLELVSGWHCSFVLERTPQEEERSMRTHLKFMKEMGCKVAIVAECARRNYHLPELKLYHRKGTSLLSDREWDTLCSGLDRLAAICESEGIPMAYHPHMGTVIQDEMQLGRLMSQTRKVGLTLDSGHLTYAGADARTEFAKYAARIRHVHFKDVRRSVLDPAIRENWTFYEAVKAGVFTVPGDGSIDYTALAEILRQQKYSGWIVVEAEQDPVKAPPLEYAKKGMAHLKSLRLEA